MPGIKETGTNTAMSTRVVAMIGLRTSAMASRVACFRSGRAFLQLAHDVFHHHDGVVHHQGHGQHQAEQGEDVDGETERQHERQGADQGDRHGDHRNQGGAHVLQEHVYHQDHQQHRLQQGHDDLMDGTADKGGGVVFDRPCHVLGKILGQPFHGLHHRFLDLQPVGVGQLRDHQKRGGLAVRS